MLNTTLLFKLLPCCETYITSIVLDPMKFSKMSTILVDFILQLNRRMELILSFTLTSFFFSKVLLIS